jgi:histidinol-phosphate aminotransferase
VGISTDPLALATKLSIVGEFVVELQEPDNEPNKQALLAIIKATSACRVVVRDTSTAFYWLNQGATKVVLHHTIPLAEASLPKDRVVLSFATLKEAEEGIGTLGQFASEFLVPFGPLSSHVEAIKNLVAAVGNGARLTVTGASTALAIAQLDKLGVDVQQSLITPNNEPITPGSVLAAILVSDRPDGLFPTVVVDEQGVALGLVYSSTESITEAVDTGRGVYYSRSRKSIWRKGETSGDTQKLVRVEVDCDRDALKFVVAQEGDGFCHLKSRSCFSRNDLGLGALMRTLESRKKEAPAGSYTKRLFEDENLLRAKLVEEANELADARTKDEVIGETADVIYFALVAAAKAGVSLADVERELDRRALKVQRRPGNAKPHIVSMLQEQDQAKQRVEQTKDPLSYLRADLNKLELYTPIKPLEVLAEEIGLPVDKLIKLDANENLYGPIPEIMEAISHANLHIYPDPSQNYLRNALSKYMGLPANCIVAGTGSDDIIDVLMRLVDPHTIITSTPTFGMYSFLGKIVQANIVDVPRLANFELDVAAISSTIQKLGCPPNRVMMFVASPNNPTGNPLSIPQVEELCRLGAFIIVDEAYAEFCEDSWRSAKELVPQIPNLVVLRTFSKWAGLAGLRVGYGAAHPKIAEWMMAIKQPYNVSAAADVAARAALEYIDKVNVTVNAMKSEKSVLLQKLSRFEWLAPSPSSSNFVLFRVTGHFSAAQVAALLRKAGVLIRYFSTPVLKDYIRISVGRPSDTDALVRELEALENTWKILDTYQPEALIFDMDGVMADVSLSYRQAIIDTAKAYSAEVTHQDINEAKAAGNANNDWILSHRLITHFHARTASGFEVPSLDAVTQTFEDIYQGVPGKTGLRELEKLLISLEQFEAFNLHLPLAIVTGRPRSDALKFLRQHNLEHLFKYVICMEDAPAKPSPEPVKMVLDKLGVKRALMVGDTPDDIRAAVGAGVVGIGILSPGDKKSPDSVKIRGALVGAGAARVIENVSELLAITSRASQHSPPSPP